MPTEPSNVPLAMFLGSKVRWDEGPGDSRVSIELGIGDIDVRLD